jgi:hemolysin activation/secretion protein
VAEAAARHVALRFWLKAALALAALAAPAGAQTVLPFPRPGDVRPPLPPPGPAPRAPELVLPPPPPLAPGGAGGEIYVRAFRVEGSTLLSPEEILELTAPYSNRNVTAEELVALRDAITLAYVNRGFLNSGAVIDAQETHDGVVEIRVIEGSLERIEVEGLHWLRDRYVRDRLALGADVPLDVNALEERMRLLREDSRIAQLHAELLPGSEPGKALLRVRAEEARPYHASLDGGTLQSPSVGTWTAGITLAHENLTGNGDTLQGSYAWSPGVNDGGGSYFLPVNARGGGVELYGRYGDSEITESPFDTLDIQSHSWTAGLGFLQPVFERPGLRLALDLRGELRESQTFLLGEPFSFSPGVENGLARLSILRFAQDALWRDDRSVIAARSVLSFGLPIFDATEASGDLPDGRFFSWLLQAQYARRLPFFGAELVARIDGQLPSDPLLSIEQFSVGGWSSVRGYRINQLVRDGALVGSVELRIPILARADGSPLLQIAPFFDNGYAWNVSQPRFGPPWIGSLGVALRVFVLPGIFAEASWGGRLRSVPTPEQRSIEDYGFSVRVGAVLF